MVESGFYLVHWDDFTRCLAEAENTEEVVEAVSDQTADLSSFSQTRQMDFIDTYEAFAPSWESPSREPFESVFYALFWDWTEDTEQTLDVPEEQAEGFDIAWSPETVQRYAEAWERVDLDSAREAYERHVSDDVFGGFDGWTAFAREHGAMVERAAREGRGLAEFVFG